MIFATAQVSSRMMAEHMPDRLLRVLQRLATQRTGDPQVEHHSTQ